MGRYIELWDLGTFESMRDGALSAEDEREAMAKRLAELGL
jgi:hypothetical protein